MLEYTVRQGDCIESIAQEYGHFWQTLWEDPNNAEIRNKRQDPNVLFQGDTVFIPEKMVKEESGATEQKHRFRRKGVPSMLRLHLLTDDQPRANELYTLEIDGRIFSGTTDAEGRLEHPIPPNAKKGRLVLSASNEEYPLHLGHIDPIDEISGLQDRLNNLGFDCGNEDGNLGHKTKTALEMFQSKYDLSITGNPDKATRDKLREIFGC